MSPEVDLSNCHREPIHVPGSIQPHGVLLSVDPDSLVARQVSESSSHHLDRSPDQLLDRSLSESLGPAFAEALADLLASGDRMMEMPDPLAVGDGEFEVRAHRHEGATIVELEPTVPSRAPTDTDRLLHGALAEVQSAQEPGALYDAAVRAVRRVTGFDRVMLYRFHEDAHGEVVAEAVARGQAPYLGLHYPASDIPNQARELYRLNPIRLIPDAEYHPAPLEPALRPDTGTPLDLSFAILRSVSPIHCEYLRNMGVRASMSLSLVQDGELWGLVACHHRTPRRIPSRVRLACEVLARAVALQNTTLLALRERARRDTLIRRTEALLGEIDRSETLSLEALAGAGRGLRELVDATGVAVSTGTGWRTEGAVPSPSVLDRLRDHVRARAAKGIYHTHALAREWDGGRECADVASGVLALVLPGPGREVLWFRPEVVRTVKWAGDPRKPVDLGPEGRLRPRRSFSLWLEEARGTADRWEEGEREAAFELRRRLLEADLARQLERAKRAVQARDEVMAVVSHDLRTPLATVRSGLDLLRVRLEGFPSDAETPGDPDLLHRVRRPLERMEQLIDDLLDVARIDAERLGVQPTVQPLAPVIEEAVASAEPDAGERGVRLEVSVDGSLRAAFEARRVVQALSNLLNNAVRHTPPGGRVRVAARPDGEEVLVTVADTGPGIPPDRLERIFDRFWQEGSGGAAGKSGLGLYIVRGIVEAHGGRIWADSTAGGARFHFTLPTVRPES